MVIESGNYCCRCWKSTTGFGARYPKMALFGATFVLSNEESSTRDELGYVTLTLVAQ